jgi:hypothetical protein
VSGQLQVPADLSLGIPVRVEDEAGKEPESPRRYVEERILPLRRTET